MSQFNCELMGLAYRPQATKDFDLTTLTEGSDLTARREPTNQYDENAIQVLFDGEFIGYIAKGLAEELAPEMDAGRELTIKVSGFVTPTKPYLDIDFLEEEAA